MRQIKNSKDFKQEVLNGKIYFILRNKRIMSLIWKSGYIKTLLVVKGKMEEGESQTIFINSGKMKEVEGVYVDVFGLQDRTRFQENFGFNIDKLLKRGWEMLVLSDSEGEVRMKKIMALAIEQGGMQ